MRDARRSFCRFDFYYDLILDNQVRTITGFQTNTFVENRQMRLSFETNARQTHFMAETLFIHCLQKPRPKVPVNLDGSRDDPARQPLVPCNLNHHNSSASQRLCVRY